MVLELPLLVLGAETLEGFGVVRGKASVCSFHNAALDARRVVHGVNFSFAGDDADLDVVDKMMDEKLMCEIEGRLG
eukprot:4340185-Alexandrium_andersonii.AAC.1